MSIEVIKAVKVNSTLHLARYVTVVWVSSMKKVRFEYWSFEAPLAICWALLTSQIDVSLNCISDLITWGDQQLTLDVCAVQPLENALLLSVSPFVCLFFCVSLECMHMHTHSCLSLCVREYWHYLLCNYCLPKLHLCFLITSVHYNG